MTTPRIVFIVGAGASAELNLPTGGALKSDIQSLLDIRFDHRQVSGDHLIVEAFRLHLRKQEKPPQEINTVFLPAARRIRDGLHQAISIDNFIDSHKDSTAIALCGKLAIARAILEAERKSKLYAKEGAAFPHEQIGITWLNRVSLKLFENCTLNGLQQRLGEVAFVVFNYDRCIEHYLQFAIQNYYGATEQQAQQLVNSMVIVHPYGTVGALPWAIAPQKARVPFGHSPQASELMKIAAEVKTFTEGTDEDSEDARVLTRVMSMAQRIVFLGFGYHRLNMQVLFPPGAARVPPTWVAGSAMGISDEDVQAIRHELVQALTMDRVHLNKCTAVDLFDRHTRGISFV